MDKDILLLTADDLKKADACKEQVDLFEKMWPRGMDITPENVQILHNNGGATLWALKYILHDPKVEVLWTEYRREVMKLYHKHGAVETDEYKKELNQLRKVYNIKALPILLDSVQLF